MTGWMDQAACSGEKGFTERPIVDQLATCAGCPVRAECLEYFLVTVPDVSRVLHYGIAFGGLTPLELHKLVRARRRSGRAPSRTFVLSDAGRRNRTAGQREARACRA